MIKQMHSFIAFTIVLFLSACTSPDKNKVALSDNAKSSMLQADREFSALSAQSGMKNAFLEYIDSNGVLLRPGIVPMAGADAVDYLIAQNDTGYTMIWQPVDAMVAKSGELGYTYGSYELRPKSGDTVLYGTYVSIWKKQADGKWKFVLDSGNEGVGK